MVEPQVVTVLVDDPARLPGTRTQTFASFLLTSSAAHRACTISMLRILSGPVVNTIRCYVVSERAG